MPDNYCIGVPVQLWAKRKNILIGNFEIISIWALYGPETHVVPVYPHFSSELGSWFTHTHTNHTGQEVSLAALTFSTVWKMDPIVPALHGSRWSTAAASINQSYIISACVSLVDDPGAPPGASPPLWRHWSTGAAGPQRDCRHWPPPPHCLPPHWPPACRPSPPPAAACTSGTSGCSTSPPPQPSWIGAATSLE